MLVKGPLTDCQQHFGQFLAHLAAFWLLKFIPLPLPLHSQWPSLKTCVDIIFLVHATFNIFSISLTIMQHKFQHLNQSFQSPEAYPEALLYVKQCSLWHLDIITKQLPFCLFSFCHFCTKSTLYNIKSLLKCNICKIMKQHISMNSSKQSVSVGLNTRRCSILR